MAGLDEEYAFRLAEIAVPIYVQLMKEEGNDPWPESKAVIWAVGVARALLEEARK